MAVIQGNKLAVANAGDSRCALSRKDQVYNLSKDHKPDLEIEKDRILKAGGHYGWSGLDPTTMLHVTSHALPLQN